MSLPKYAPHPTIPAGPSRISMYLSSLPSNMSDWFNHPRTLGLAPKTMAFLYITAAISSTMMSLGYRLVVARLGFSADMFLMLLVLTVSGTAYWALVKRKPLAFTPFLVTVVLCIIFTIVIWFVDHVPQAAYKSDELLALGAVIYIYLHVIRTVLCARRLMIEDIKNEIYGRF